MTEELNRRHNLATMPTINNNGESYIVPFDIYKEGYEAYDISNWFKGRVGDNGTPFGIRWYKHGQLMDVTGMRPFIEGQVGDYTIDDSDPDDPKINMDSEASNVHVVGEVNDCQEYGVAIYRLINQAMPQSGIFYGKIGVMGTQDDGTTVMSSVDVVFKVLAGHMSMVGARKFYVSELEKALLDFKAKIKQHNQEYAALVKQHIQEFQDQTKKFNDDTQKIIDDARNTYETETKNAHDSLDALKSQIQANRDEQANLAQHLAGTEQQIETHDVITRPEFNNLSNQLTQQVSEMRQSGLEFFDNSDALKAAYPQGANKLCVTLDDSHQWIYDYANSRWNDAGTFNFGTLDPKLMQAFYAKDPDNLVLNSDFNGIQMWTAGRDGAPANVYIDNTDAVNGSNVLVMNGYLKDGTRNASWVYSSKFAVNAIKNPTLSIATDLYVSGINTEVGDVATIELDMFDKDNNVTRVQRTILNNSDFQRIEWNNIQLDPKTVSCYIAFTMIGLGQIKIRRPQVNFGVKALPYSKKKIAEENTNLLATSPIVDWNYDLTSPIYKIDKKNSYKNNPTLNITYPNNDPSDHLNFHFPISPMIKVDPGSVISATVPLKGSYDVINAKVVLEIDQYSDLNSVEDTLLTWYSSNLHFSNDNFEEINLNNIKLDQTTNYVIIKLVTVNKVNVNVGNIELYESKYAPATVNHINSYLQEKDIFWEYPLSKWDWSETQNGCLTIDNSTLDNDGNPTLKVKTLSDNDNVIVLAKSIKIKDKKLSFKFEYRQNVSGNNKIWLLIRQYANSNEPFDLAKEIELALPNTNSMVEKSFKDILLNDDTQYIDVVILGSGVVDANFSNFKQIPNTPNTEKDLITEFDTKNLVAGFDTTKCQMIRLPDKPLKMVSTDQNPNTFYIISSAAYNVQGDTSYTIKIKASASYDEQSKIYLTADQSNSIDGFQNGSASETAFFLDNDSYKEYAFTFKTKPDTQYALFKFAIKGSGTVELGKFKLYQGNPDADAVKNYILPQLNIMTDATITEDWQKAPFTFIKNGHQVTGYLQFSMQGQSSRGYPKKNLKIKLFKDADCKSKLKIKPKADWTANNKFNIKANYMDATQSRNLVNADLFANASAITPFEHNSQMQLYKAQKLGQMEGFPIELYFNYNYYGLMSFNTKKDEKTFALDGDNTANEALTIPSTDVTFDNPSDTIDQQMFGTVVHDQANDTLKANLSKFQTFVRDSTDTDFKNKIGTYIDVKSAINCMLWSALSNMIDSPNKSLILLTWNNGVDFYITLYDLDSTWNLWWNGSKLISDPLTSLDNPFSFAKQWGNALFNKLYKNFKSEIKAQWINLRSNVWRNDQLIDSFKNYIKAIPEEAFERDQTKWPDIPSKSITNFEQIQQAIIERGNAMDSLMEHLADSDTTSPQPTTPQAQPTEPKQ